MTLATLLQQTTAVVACLRLFEPSNSSSDGYIASSTAAGSGLLLCSFPRAKKSKVWRHFWFLKDNGEIVDTKKVICRLFEYFLSYLGIQQIPRVRKEPFCCLHSYKREYLTPCIVAQMVFSANYVMILR